MSHVLNKLTGVNFGAFKAQLEQDAAEHAKQGMHLEHIWRNADNPEEIYFLFRVEDLEQHRTMMNKLHSEARAKNPDIVLPEKLFLEEL